MRASGKYILFILLFGLSLSLDAQQRDRKAELQRQKIRLLDEIELANRILGETKANEKASLGNIQTVERKIKLRENLLSTLDKEVELLGEDISALENDIDTLTKEVAEQKEAYANMIRQAYKSRSQYSRLMFILSSRDFNQALKRLEYMKQYAEFRRQQVKRIEAKQAELAEKVQELTRQKVRKEALRGQMSVERSKLEEEKKAQEASIDKLKLKEKEIAAELNEKQKQAKKVETEIQRIIAEEIRRAKEKAIRNQIEEEAKRVGLVAGKDFSSRTKNDDLKDLIEKKKRELRAANKPVEETAGPVYDLTPEARQLAANFAANRQNLPWPVERGIVTSRFGKQSHPIAKGVIINNTGIDITTERNSTAKACFGGEVSIVRIPGGAFAVIIRHGNYFTVYQNLADLKVADGQTVTNGQELGTVFYNEGEQRSLLHFEVWKDNKPQDPSPWLARK
jgi:septal ring factor EnvC (AmiA/AmiB activator)